MSYQADDDSYIFTENLRDLLAPMDPEKKTCFGHAFRSRNGGTWMSGGAGYILSRAAFQEFIETYILPERGKFSVETKRLLEVRGLCQGYTELCRKKGLFC